MSYFINGNINALNWLSDKLKHVLSSTANSIISIGDGNPFFSNGYIVDIVIDDSLAEPEFQPMDNQRYRLSMNRDDFVELSGKIDGMVDLKKPCHNYFDIGSGYVSQIFLTTGEYSDPLLIKMAQDGRLR